MPDDPWYSTPQARRKRKLVGFTLSDAARARLERLSIELARNKSWIVEKLIMGKYDEMTLDELIAEARKHVMTDDERREQLANFAFGNLALTKEWSSKPVAELERLRQLCRRFAGCK